MDGLTTLLFIISVTFNGLQAYWSGGLKSERDKYREDYNILLEECENSRKKQRVLAIINADSNQSKAEFVGRELAAQQFDNREIVRESSSNCGGLVSDVGYQLYEREVRQTDTLNN